MQSIRDDSFLNNIKMGDNNIRWMCVQAHKFQKLFIISSQRFVKFIIQTGLEKSIFVCLFVYKEHLWGWKGESIKCWWPLPYLTWRSLRLNDHGRLNRALRWKWHDARPDIWSSRSKNWKIPGRSREILLFVAKTQEKHEHKSYRRHR